VGGDPESHGRSLADDEQTERTRAVDDPGDGVGRIDVAARVAAAEQKLDEADRLGESVQNRHGAFLVSWSLARVDPVTVCSG
jgi:hypothetical protein